MVLRMSPTRGGAEYAGYDLKIHRSGEDILIKVEVKGTEGDGISDAYESEFSVGDNPKFLPDVLCLVRLKKDDYQLDRIIILKKDEINQFEHKPVRRVRFSHTLKTKIKNGEFLTLKEHDYSPMPPGVIYLLPGSSSYFFLFPFFDKPFLQLHKKVRRGLLPHRHRLRIHNRQSLQ